MAFNKKIATRIEPSRDVFFPEGHILNGYRNDLRLYSNELHDSSRDIPVLDIEIAILIPVRTVCTAEDTFDPLFLRNVVVDSFSRIRIVTQHSHDGIALVENHQSSVEIRNGNIIALNGSRGWHS